MEQNNTVVENKEEVQQQTAQQTEIVEKQETPEQINWRKFREAREIERKQLEEERRRAKQKEEEAAALKAAMDALLNKPQPAVNQYEDEETEDQKIEKKVKLALEQRERQLEEERRHREQAEFPQKLASAYSDFNQICTPDNLDYLEYHYPEVAAGFKYMPEGFDKWAAIYKAVKRFVSNTDSKKDQAKAEKNLNKPQSMVSSGVTQTGDTAPVILDDKRRSDNWARMQRVMKGGR